MLKDGEASRQDIEEVSNDSIIWNAILKLFSTSKIYTNINNEDIQTYSGNFPSHLQRFLGAYLCTIDFLVERFPSSINFYIQCLYNSLFSGQKNSKVLFSLMNDYRSIFPYCYMFTRRLGKTPKQQMSLWASNLNPSSSKPKDISFNSPTHPKLLEPGVFSTSSKQRSPVTTTSKFFDDSKSSPSVANPTPNSNGWDYDEDEDSGPDHQSYNKPVIKKRMTRMRTNTPTTNDHKKLNESKSKNNSIEI